MHIEQLVPMVYVSADVFWKDLITDAVYHEMILFHLCLSPKLFSLWLNNLSFFDFSEMPGPHRRTGNFLPGGAINHLPKKISQVAQIFPKESKRNEGHIATT